jgi:hypothetical protein
MSRRPGKKSMLSEESTKTIRAQALYIHNDIYIMRMRAIPIGVHRYLGFPHILITLSVLIHLQHPSLLSRDGQGGCYVWHVDKGGT